jgi:hypothetical protein
MEKSMSMKGGGSRLKIMALIDYATLVTDYSANDVGKVGVINA